MKTDSFPVGPLAGALLTATIFVFAILPGSSHAIPNVIGGGGVFFQMAGMHLEDFVNRPQTWERNARLEGEWAPRNDPAVTDRDIEMSKLSVSAVVFGIPASEVTVQRRDGRVLQFRVVFRPDSPGEAPRLAQKVRTNAAAWAGGNRGDAILQAGATEIRWLESGDSIAAVFTAREKSPADPS